ncbi:MAG TPA: SAM-dependent methyltransferase [Bacteroidia bacterium]|nr:SAM-dependent methyltransferase [Bacteroidia bacterium]
MGGRSTLYLIPVPLSEAPIDHVIPEHNLNLVRGLKRFIAENSKNCRKFLKQAAYPSIPEAQILELNEHSRMEEQGEFLNFLKEEGPVGLMSDAGCPGIADPGAAVVRLAHLNGIPVIPLVGPSSILLSIMSSGLNGQNFAFNGYLPVDRHARSRCIRDLEQKARKTGQAQYFIETPYRNEMLFKDLLEVLPSVTLLFVGRDISGARQLVMSKCISDWKKTAIPQLDKLPTVFGIGY